MDIILCGFQCVCGVFDEYVLCYKVFISYTVLICVFRFFLSSALCVLGCFFGFVGCGIFVSSSYPESIVSSCFYSNSSIEPPPGSWFLRVHFGTRVLRGGQFQFLGSLLYAASCAVWIQEDYLYGTMSKKHEITPVHDEGYILLVCAFITLVFACYYQLLAQYPQSVLLRNGNRVRASSVDSVTGLAPSEFLNNHLGSNTQISGWFFELFALVWLFQQAVQFDVSAEDDGYDWGAFYHTFVAFGMALGSYFMLAQAYREGSRMDAVLISQAKKRTEPDVERGVSVHPLSGIADLTDSKQVLRRSRKLITTKSNWKNSSDGIWKHVNAHAILFQARLTRVDPLLLAAILQSEAFKSFQLANYSIGSSVKVVGKLALNRSSSAVSVGGTNSSSVSSHGTMYYEKFPPNPPMPAHESLFASLLHETRQLVGHDGVVDCVELIEWSVGGSSPSEQNLLRVDPFRYYSITAEGMLTGVVWLEEIARWMPDFLLQTEMDKFPTIVKDLKRFCAQTDLVEKVEHELNFWIWQKVHNSITPLNAAVLVRTAPSYRVLLSKFSGLRTKIPDTVSSETCKFPSKLSELETTNIPQIVKSASDFLTNEYSAWALDEASCLMKPGRPKITVWRRSDFIDEPVEPFRIQTRIHGIDPLTLATLIHRNKLDGLVHVLGKRTSLGEAGSRRGSGVFASAPGPLVSSVSYVGDTENGITVSSSLIGSYQDGQVRVFHDRKRRTRYMPTSRDRSFTFASVMKDVSPLKAVVVHFGVDALSDSSDVVCLKKYQVWFLENDGGTDTKLTWGGLIPVGGRTEKMSALFSKGSELKDKMKYVEKLVNIFAIDSIAKDAIAETHAYIAYSTMRRAISRELKKLSISYLSQTSNDYKALLAEIQPISATNVMGFEEDLKAEIIQRRKSSVKPKATNDNESSSSDITIPFSPVPSHLRLEIENDDDEVKTQKNSELDEQEDVIPVTTARKYEHMSDDHEVANERDTR